MEMSYSDKVKEYLQAAGRANTHAGKLVVFSELLRSIFGVSSYEIVQNVEQYIKAGGLMILKGRMDLRLGQTIIEFKINLAKELDAAKEEIERYVAILRKNDQKVAECVVTDGIKFKVFVVREKVKEVRSINFQEMTPEQTIMFLDTYLFSTRRVPNAEDLNMRFGPGSPIYEEIVGQLAALFALKKDSMKFALWSKNMQLVYGSTPPEEAFVSQTYLMMLVRLLLARYLIKGVPPAKETLSGELFDSQGIKIIEDDFFSWVLDPDIWLKVKPLIETLMYAFDYYDLESVDEDIFKEIYQEIVKRGERHRIGEYYTPEWLAETTLQEAITALSSEGNVKIFSILDPACGSGTFLTNVVSILRKNGCSLADILENVYGMDLNPLAVAIARSNYLLALGRLIEQRKEAVFIPVYMADSIKLPSVRKELLYGTDILVIDIDHKTQLDLPLEIALDENRLKEVLEIFADILVEYKSKRLDRKQAMKAFESSYHGGKPDTEILKRTLQVLMELIDVDQDSVWVFMMRNIYAPLRMKEKQFDIVAGNPPWVSFKYIENPNYQKFVKDTVFKYRLLDRKQTDLFTQMDTSTVFYAKAADLYLDANGILAFVMPRSVLTGAKQHEAFKHQRKPLMRILTILDVEKVEPLFGVPACSLIGKKGEETTYPVRATRFSGSLPEKNLRLKQALKYISLTERKYSPPAIEEEVSRYHKKVLEGACIVPRTLWFIDFVTGPFGINPDMPLVESLVLPDAKDPWKKVSLKSEVESEFIFLTITGKLVLPFKPRFLPVALPIKKGRREITILSSKDLRRSGKLKMANWLDEAQKAWVKNATKTSLKNFPNAMDYVNYHGKLILQRQNLNYYVVYTASGTHIAATVVNIERLPNLKIGKANIHPSGFIADYTTFWYGTNDIREAYYLAAILNSNVLDQKIKKHQPKGKFGPRHICRLPFEFNIPQFDPNRKFHKKIAMLGLRATIQASKMPKTSRLKMKAVIPAMKTIDALVLQLLSK
jgi:type I restriction-modification system DNA methylase subunit